jgi:hypothetical protein
LFTPEVAARKGLLWRVLLLLLLLLLQVLQLLLNLRPPLGFDHLDLRGQLFDPGVQRRLFRWRLSRRG